MNERNLQLVVKIVKENGKFVVKENSIEKYEIRHGVWAMWTPGLECKDAILLEVGQSIDIVAELTADINSIISANKEVKEYRKKDYTARRFFPTGFSKKFTVLKTDKNRTSAKYRIISETFNEISIYILQNTEARSSNQNEREKIEYEYAVDRKAIFWNAFGNQRKLANIYYKNFYS